METDKPRLRTYYVVWTYVANFSTTPLAIQARSKAHAASQVYAVFSDDFRKRATLHITRERPKSFSSGGTR